MEEQGLTREGIEALEKMANEGAKNASSSLSKLIDEEVEVKTLAVRTLPIEKVSSIISSPEVLTTTIVMEIKGDVDGSIMLVYPQQSAINVADLLAKRELGSITELDELDESSLKESGNIISGAFLSAISNYLTINMIETVPNLITNKIKDTIDLVLAGFAEKEASKAVAFEIDFAMGTTKEKDQKIKAYFVLLLDVVSATKVLESLKKISGGQLMVNK